MDIFDKCERALVDLGDYFEKDRDAMQQVFFRTGPVHNVGPWVELDGRQVLQFATNDYLGLCNHPNVREAALAAVEAYGVGLPMGSRALSGDTALHGSLECAVAEFKKTESALVFPNGFDAMIGVVAALCRPRDWVVLDSQAHASLVYGARIANAQIRFFDHNDPQSLEGILASVPKKRGVMVIVDGVYSMRGDLAPLPALCEVCRRYGARILVDDAHGTGVFGRSGRGTAAFLNVEDQIDLHLGTFSKAVGTTGGFVAGPRSVLEFIRRHAPTVLFTKAMPAIVASATREALGLMVAADSLRSTLWDNTRLLHQGLRELGYDLGDSVSPITPIRCWGNDATHLAAALFEEFGIWAGVAVYPAVSVGTSVVRVVPTARHTAETIASFLSAMSKLADRSFVHRLDSPRWRSTSA